MTMVQHFKTNTLWWALVGIYKYDLGKRNSNLGKVSRLLSSKVGKIRTLGK